MNKFSESEAYKMLIKIAKLDEESLRKASDYIDTLLLAQRGRDEEDTEKYYVYTDGSSKPLPDGKNQAGLAYIVVSSKRGIIDKYSESLGNKTSFHAELSCVIKAFEKLDLPEATIFTDCFTIVTGIAQIPTWQKAGWKTKNGTDLKEKKLWKKLSELIEENPGYKVHWVKGHGDDFCNIQVDSMAKKAAGM